jgi:Bifunctional DNA primase/polymerase, N-terminal/Family of unknown function (DUF5906)
MAIHITFKGATAQAEHAATDAMQGASAKPYELTAGATSDSNAGVVAKLKLVKSSSSDAATGPSHKGIGASTDQSVLAFALKYAEQGLPVLLAKPNTKESYPGDKVGSAMLDTVEIQTAFTTHPNSNVAVVPGLEAGVVVLDVDVKNGKPGQKMLAALESFCGQTDTLTCTTPSGGRHLYFKHPGGQLPHKEILPGVELYAEAKLMAPPSIVDGKPYQWIDASEPVAECPPRLAEVLTWTIDGTLCKVVSLLSEHWNKASSRQYVCLAVAGFLARRGWPSAKTVFCVRMIHALANDDKEDLEKRLQGVKDTYAKFEANKAKPSAQHEPLTGLPEIGKELGGEVASELMKLVGTKPATADELAGPEIEELNAQYAVVSTGSKVVILHETMDPSSNEPTAPLMGVADFRLWLKNRLVDGKALSELWLASPHRRQFDGIVFTPGMHTPGFYNLWKGFPIQPAAGDCSKFLKHIEEVICRANTVVTAYVLNWCAHLVQRPAELPEVALVLRGLQGTGKGVFARGLGKLVGATHSIHLTSMNQIVGKFNGHLAGKLLVFADEALWGGNRQSDGALKALITEPETPIEQKTKDIITVRNYTRLIIASNASWAVPLDLDDRRFLALDVSDTHKEDTSYFSAIDVELNNGGLAALMKFLLERDLSNFNVRAMPKTGFGFDMKLKSAGSVWQWWYGKLCDTEAQHWQEFVEKDTLHSEYLEWCKVLHFQHPETKELFGKEIRKLEPDIKECRPSKKVGWENRPRCFKLPSLPKCRAAFQAYSKSGPEIWKG